MSGKRGPEPRASTGKSAAAGSAVRDDVRALAPRCLAGRRALVTGAGTGIGRGIALRLAELGASVVGVGRRPEPLAETAELIAAGRGPGAFTWRSLNVRDRDAAAAALEQIATGSIGLATTEKVGGAALDLLVNNAGGQFIAPAADISDRGMASVLDLNLTAVAALTRAARPFLAARGGTVVTISLSSPERGITGLAHSASARAAILALTAELAGEWREDGIRLYGLAPGTVLTDGVRGEMPPEALAATVKNTPLRTDTATREIAEWVAALAAGVGPLPSGTVLQLDGGAGIHGVRGLEG